MDQDGLIVYQEEFLSDAVFEDKILTGDSAASDLLRWLYADRLDCENLQQGLAYVACASQSDPETWQKWTVYHNVFWDQASDREFGRTGPGDC